MPLYLHVLLGVLIVSFLWFGLTLAFVKPPVRDIPSTRSPPMTFQSDSSTIVVDTPLKDVSTKDILLTGIILNEQSESISHGVTSSKTVTAGASDGFITLNNPFSDVDAPVKVSSSPSLALYPFVRRMSLPRHRSSLCIPASTSRADAPLRQHATMRRHGSLAEDNESYSPHVPSGKVRTFINDDEKEQGVECPLSDSVSKSAKSATKNPLAPHTSKKLTKIKRAVTKRFRTLFHHSPPS
ncbi:hypothetical protein H2248_012008 [Termitomyces sp. 'cryptogamus']|nr:hypothetical protein H2248_012008 [Termitomyces sp. 'cryptogamus']